MRIVVLDKDKKVEKDYIDDLGNINVNIIDRPSFCIYARTNNNGFDNIIFRFSNLDEENVSAEFGSHKIIANYGLISGCIYSMAFKLDEYNPKDITSICKVVKEKNTSVRFQNNVKRFFDLAKAIIESVNSLSAK